MTVAGAAALLGDLSRDDLGRDDLSLDDLTRDDLYRDPDRPRPRVGGLTVGRGVSGAGSLTSVSRLWAL